MSVVLPESMNQIDTSKVKESLETIENYIRYIEERIDYFTTIRARETTNEIASSVNGSITTSENRIILAYTDALNALEADLKKLVDTSQGDLKNLVKAEIESVNAMIRNDGGVFKVLGDGNVNTGWTITSADGMSIIKASASGIGISNDGGQTFSNAITGDGVVANSLIIGDSELEHYVSIENGAIRLGADESDVNLKIESDAVGFFNQQGQLLARFTSNGLEFSRESFQSIRLGNYVIKARNDGSIYFDII